MAKLNSTLTVRRESSNGSRRYTLRDMAVIKHDQSIRNAKINRGEVELRGNNHGISVCGCGVEGCFVHFSSPNR